MKGEASVVKTSTKQGNKKGSTAAVPKITPATDADLVAIKMIWSRASLVTYNNRSQSVHFGGASGLLEVGQTSYDNKISTHSLVSSTGCSVCLGHIAPTIRHLFIKSFF